MGLFRRFTWPTWRWSPLPTLSDPPAPPTVNPATGLPMIGGTTGVDVAGNPFGADLSRHRHDDWHRGPLDVPSPFDDHRCGRHDPWGLANMVWGHDGRS